VSGTGPTVTTMAAGASADELPGAAWLQAFARSGRRDLGALMRFKQALLQSLPTAEAFALYRQAAGLPGAHCLRWRQLASLREVAQTQPGAFYEIAAAGLPFVAPPPKVFGAGDRRPLAGITRSTFVACLTDAWVRGRSAFITADDHAVLDLQGGELASFGDRLDVDPGVVQARQQLACMIEPGDDDDLMEIEEAFHLIGPHADALGRWIVEYLAKYVAARMAHALPSVPVLIDAGLPATHRQALAAMLDGVAAIELPAFQPARVRRLWCAAGEVCAASSRAWDWPLVPPARFAPIRHEMARRAGLARGGGSERVLLAGASARSTLSNYAAIAAAASARGFRIVDPDELDFAGQVALVADAHCIAGAGPEAMFLPCFAGPGTRLCLLHPADTPRLAAWNGLFEGSGLDIIVLTGSSLTQDPDDQGRTACRIDAAAFAAVLERWRDERPLAAVADAPAPTGDAAPAAAPLVSLVLVAYRHENFVAAAVRGALAQTYAPLDVIIVDDASPDATAEVIAAELARHPDRTDIRFIRHPENLGAFAAWRNSLSLARGEFIVCSAGDDIMLPGMVEQMVGMWRREAVSLVTANARYIDAAGNELNRFYRDPDAVHDDSFETLARDGVNATCFGAAMGFERALYHEFGCPPEHLSAPDIMLPFYAYLRKGARFIAEPLLKYRVHAGNTSLSLQAERSSHIDRLAIEAEIFYVHLAHSLQMTEELERLGRRDPVRAAEIAGRIKPLLATQTTETARKLIATRIALGRLGVARLTAPRIS
jgi:Glycosyl transferase family 2/Glycosyltransferase 61